VTGRAVRPGVVALTAAVAAYNNLVNRFEPFRRGWAVPINLAATASLLALARWVLRLDPAALGLRGPHRRAARVGAGIAAALVAPLFAALAHPTAARLVADERVAGLDASGLAARALVRIPLATALLEEVAFRGVLYAAWLPAGPAAATAASSAAFGIWHVVPTIDALRANRPSLGAGAVAVGVAAGVLVTGAAGWGLVWLRRWTGSLAGPVAFHATLNSLATVAAWLAHRRVS
jgi:membrane protease YdiL (CAAX protease family)